MKLSQLFPLWECNLNVDPELSGLHNDSRRIQSGFLFLAYAGALADGRRFIAQALERGASSIAYEPREFPEICELPHAIPCVPVEGLAQKLAEIAAQFYHYPSRALSITGVTGTNGKTTIAWQLARAYEMLGMPAAYMGTLGQGKPDRLQELANTTPDALCIQRLLRGYQQQGITQVCMEVSSHALTQQRVDCLDFSHAIYTNLSHEHLDYHKTMSAYAYAKAMLFAMPMLKTAVLNGDDEYMPVMRAVIPSGCEVLTYGFSAANDIQVLQCEISRTGSRFTLRSPWGIFPLHIKAIGHFNIYNALAVFSSLVMKGVSVEDTVQVMAQLPTVPGRMEVVSESPCVIVDYAHTPDALKNVLLTLKQMKQGRLITVFGCGGARDEAKRPMMGQIASQYSDQCIVTSDNPRTEDPIRIIQAIRQGMSHNSQILEITNREQAIRKAVELADVNDIVLIAGKGHEAYQQSGHERVYFSDQACVRKILSQ